MADLMHHDRFPDGSPGLRVNALDPHDSDAMDVYRERGWRLGPHKDTDPDDPAEVPRVLPEAEVDDEPKPEPIKPRSRPRKATSKKAS